MPACRSGAAASTVAVSGATISASPRPKSVSGGSTWVQYDTPSPTPVSQRAPSAITIGPTVIGIRGPMRLPSSPPLPARKIMQIVMGSVPAPARRAPYPSTVCSCSTRKNGIAPSAA